MRLLLDTHVLVWLLTDSDRISTAVYNQIERAAAQDLLRVSAITPWEIAMIVAKGRLVLARDVGDWVDAVLSLPGIHLEPLSPAIAVASTRLLPTPIRSGSSRSRRSDTDRNSAQPRRHIGHRRRTHARLREGRLSPLPRDCISSLLPMTRKHIVCANKITCDSRSL
jgi:PIN domain nuclease of toxin-antitoxin system